MVFNGTGNFEEYGQLFRINECLQTNSSLSKRCRLPADLGVITLVVQGWLYNFLLLCCYEVLRGLTKEPLQILKVRSLESEPTCESHLTSIAAEAPYRCPMKLDFHHLERLVEAKLAEAEDFLWALREDPGCFASHLEEAFQHCVCWLPNAGEKPFPTGSNDCSESAFWGVVMHRALGDAVLAIDQWGWTLDKLRELQVLRCKYATEIAQNDSLPQEYLSALYIFYYSRDRLILSTLRAMTISFAASPQMRDKYMFKYEASTREFSFLPRTELPGEIPWTDFLHALKAVGFQAEKLYGSAWHFTPTERTGIRGSIQIHEPHPNSKIPYVIARRISRRLNRHYGWNSGTFVPKGWWRLESC
jgi:hypothetical protein